MFITFEGVEGCGKSTQVELLVQYLKEQNHKTVIQTKEPGGTKIGSQIRQILLDVDNKSITANTELLLYIADRIQHIDELIRPNLEKENHIIICDRYHDSTIAYQCGGRMITNTDTLEIFYKSNLYINPDITFLLDIDPVFSIKRAIDRNKEENKENSEGRFEAESLDFHKRVRNKYLELAEENKDRIVIINANQSINNIHKNIIMILKNII